MVKEKLIVIGPEDIVGARLTCSKCGALLVLDFRKRSPNTLPEGCAECGCNWGVNPAQEDWRRLLDAIFRLPISGPGPVAIRFEIEDAK